MFLENPAFGDIPQATTVGVRCGAAFVSYFLINSGINPWPVRLSVQPIAGGPSRGHCPSKAFDPVQPGEICIVFIRGVNPCTFRLISNETTPFGPDLDFSPDVACRRYHQVLTTVHLLRVSKISRKKKDTQLMTSCDTCALQEMIPHKTQADSQKHCRNAPKLQVRIVLYQKESDTGQAKTLTRTPDLVQAIVPEASNEDSSLNLSKPFPSTWSHSRMAQLPSQGESSQRQALCTFTQNISSCNQADEGNTNVFITEEPQQQNYDLSSKDAFDKEPLLPFVSLLEQEQKSVEGGILISDNDDEKQRHLIIETDENEAEYDIIDSKEVTLESKPAISNKRVQIISTEDCHIVDLEELEIINESDDDEFDIVDETDFKNSLPVQDKDGFLVVSKTGRHTYQDVLSLTTTDTKAYSLSYDQIHKEEQQKFQQNEQKQEEHVQEDQRKEHQQQESHTSHVTIPKIKVENNLDGLIECTPKTLFKDDKQSYCKIIPELHRGENHQSNSCEYMRSQLMDAELEFEFDISSATLHNCLDERKDDELPSYDEGSLANAIAVNSFHDCEDTVLLHHKQRRASSFEYQCDSDSDYDLECTFNIALDKICESSDVIIQKQPSFDVSVILSDEDKPWKSPSCIVEKTYRTKQESWKPPSSNFDCALLFNRPLPPQLLHESEHTYKRSEASMNQLQTIHSSYVLPSPSFDISKLSL